MIAGELRNSQRVPLRCTECAQRRVKCDKEIPCRRCITNRRAHLCMREIVRVRGKRTVATPTSDDTNASLAQQNSRLYERVAELELALAMSLQGRSGLQSGQNIASADTSTRQPRPFEEVRAVLDDWNIGSVEHGKSYTSTSCNDMPNFPEIQRIIPNKATSTRIVEFSLRVLGWIHCALRVDEFLTQHEAFQNSLEGENPRAFYGHGWLATYFSILTVGLFFMSDEETQLLNLPAVGAAEAPLAVCHLWYRSVFWQLELSDAMGKPQIHVVQVAAILTLCHSHFGETHREINLTSLAHNTARALQMHRLGTEASYPHSLERFEEWSTESGRERGRRLWWTLVICDWLQALRRPPSIQPDSFDCTLTPGRFDYNLVLGSSPVSDGVVVFSPLLHHMELAKLARLFYDYQQTPKKSSAMLCDVLEKMDELEIDFVDKFSQISASFTDGINQGQLEPTWVLAQRAHFLCSTNFIRLALCRILLEPALSQLPAWSEIRNRGIRAAMTIVHMEHIPPEYQLMWLFGSAPIAAGVFLCLDLLIPGEPKTVSQVENQQSSVELCIATLQRHSHKTNICREGSKTLRRLLDFELSQRGRQVSQEDITHFIMNMGSHSEQKMHLPASREQGNSAMGSSLVDEEVATGDMESSLEGMSSILPSMVNGCDDFDISWFMDTIMMSDYFL